MIAKLKSAAGTASAAMRRGYEKCRGAYYGAGAALMAATAASPVFCSGGGVNIDATFQSIMEILYSIAMYMGIGIVAYAIFSWVLAMKDDNADGQARAIRFLVVGIVLAGLGTIAGPIVNNLLGTT